MQVAKDFSLDTDVGEVGGVFCFYHHLGHQPSSHPTDLLDELDTRKNA